MPCCRRLRCAAMVSTAAGRTGNGVSHQQRHAHAGSVDVEALRWAFAMLVERHESLRTVFRALPEGGAEQVIEPFTGFELPVR